MLALNLNGKRLIDLAGALVARQIPFVIVISLAIVNSMFPRCRRQRVCSQSRRKRWFACFLTLSVLPIDCTMTMNWLCREVTSRTIKVLHDAKRIAHQGPWGGSGHGTDPDHTPSAHRRAAWSPEERRPQRSASAIRECKTFKKPKVQ